MWLILKKKMCNGEFSFLPMPLVSSMKYQSKLPKILLVHGQCLDRVIFFLNPFNFNDFHFETGGKFNVS